MAWKVLKPHQQALASLRGRGPREEPTGFGTDPSRTLAACSLSVYTAHACGLRSAAGGPLAPPSSDQSPCSHPSGGQAHVYALRVSSAGPENGKTGGGPGGAQLHPLAQRAVEAAPLCQTQPALRVRTMAFLSPPPRPAWACRPLLLCSPPYLPPCPRLSPLPPLMVPAHKTPPWLCYSIYLPPPTPPVSADIPSSRQPPHRGQLS